MCCVTQSLVRTAENGKPSHRRPSIINRWMPMFFKHCFVSVGTKHQGPWRGGSFFWTMSNSGRRPPSERSKHGCHSLRGFDQGFATTPPVAVSRRMLIPPQRPSAVKRGLPMCCCIESVHATHHKLSAVHRWSHSLWRSRLGPCLAGLSPMR